MWQSITHGMTSLEQHRLNRLSNEVNTLMSFSHFLYIHTCITSDQHQPIKLLTFEAWRQIVFVLLLHTRKKAVSVFLGNACVAYCMHSMHTPSFQVQYIPNEEQQKKPNQKQDRRIQNLCKHFRSSADRFTLRFQLTANGKVHKN